MGDIDVPFWNFMANMVTLVLVALILMYMLENR